VEVNCAANDVLSVFNEDKSFRIFDYCSALQNDSTAGNFVLARAKYLLLRLETRSERVLAAVFDLFFLDDPSVAAVVSSEPVFIFGANELPTTQPPKINGISISQSIMCSSNLINFYLFSITFHLIQSQSDSSNLIRFI
jgi:hypothetical protein